MNSLYYQINDHYLSRVHCKIRLLTPIIFEIIDLGSTNGTIVNEIKLAPNVSYFFIIDNSVILGNSTTIEIESLFDKLGIIIKKREIGITNIPISSNMPHEGQFFNEMILINISKEYFELPNFFEFNQINDNNFSIVNKVFGFNNSMMFQYYFSINKGIEIIFINIRVPSIINSEIWFIVIITQQFSKHTIIIVITFLKKIVHFIFIYTGRINNIL